VTFRRNAIALAAALGAVAACDEATPTAPVPAAVVTATPSPEPTPAPTPTPSPEPTPEGRRLAPGPVHHVHIKVHAIRESDRVNYRAVYEEDGAWVLFTGEMAVIDATAKNADDKACDYRGNPEWSYEESVEGIVREARSPNPFLLMLDATELGSGSVSVSATVDDAPSNGLLIDIRRN